MREAEKVERFRLSRFPLSALLRGVSTIPDQTRLVRVAFKFEVGEAFAHCCKKAPCFPFILKPHYAVVCIAHKDDIASSMPLAPLVCLLTPTEN
jgi:hypothetical protein